MHPATYYGLLDGVGADRFFDGLLAALAKKWGESTQETASRIRFPRFSGEDSCILKIRAFDAVKQFEASNVVAVLAPWQNQAVIEEIRAETCLPVLGLAEALRAELLRRHSGGRIGVLCSDAVRESRFFEHLSPQENWTWLYPEVSTERLADVCRDLVHQGAELILTDAAHALTPGLREQGFPVIDVWQVYAEYVAQSPTEKKKPFKIGVVGGVGPAATVDLLDKIVRHTPAKRDQEHLKIVVEMNPQIPDRTAHLIGDGVDPTIALYATCKRLEAADAHLIAIPCNTAHAFVERIQPFLSIPIINMLRETAACIRANYGHDTKVGLLATTGTIASRVYHEAIGAAGFEILIPDAENQERVMNAIYGPKGVKAGFTEGECTDDLLQALASLVTRGAQVIILGCTELPLLLAQNDAFPVAGKTVAVLDPTDILAKRCVALGR